MDNLKWGLFALNAPRQVSEDSLLAKVRQVRPQVVAASPGEQAAPGEVEPTWLRQEEVGGWLLPGRPLPTSQGSRWPRPH